MKWDRALRCASFLIVIGLMASLPLLAQKITGDISGTVQDTTGAVVKDVKITATNSATGETRSATTSDSGFYRVIELPPGIYKVSATAPGFKTSARDVQVALSLVTQSDFQLQPGQVSETVEVEGTAPLVETTEDRLSTLFDSRRVEDLPNNGRDFNNLLDGVPGVQRSPGGGFQSLNINGQRATSNNYAIDGIPNNDRYYGESSLGQAAISGTAAALIPLEGISEFNVQSNPGVEFGVKGGSVINIGLKSGTNEIHGSAFWDRHTDAFDARNWFASEVTPFRLNQFGASGGFPIKKDKAFLFLSYQGFHLKDVFPSQVNLPAQAEIADATACVATGVNPNSVGDPNPGDLHQRRLCRSGSGPNPGHGRRWASQHHRRGVTFLYPIGSEPRPEGQHRFRQRSGSEQFPRQVRLRVQPFPQDLDQVSFWRQPARPARFHWSAAVRGTARHQWKYVEFGGPQPGSIGRPELHLDNKPNQGAGKQIRVYPV